MPRPPLVAERLTEAQLDALAAIQPSDLDRAAMHWREVASDAYRRIEDARLWEGGADAEP